MRVFNLVYKMYLEQKRDWAMLILTLSFAPFFAIIYYVMYGSFQINYNLSIINEDRPGNIENYSKDLISGLQNKKFKDGKNQFDVSFGKRLEEEVVKLQNKELDIIYIIPINFSETILHSKNKTLEKSSTITLYGDLSSSKYLVGAILLMTAIEDYIKLNTPNISLFELKEIPLGTSGSRTDFEEAIPGLLVSSVIMLLFTASISLLKEVETGTIKRLILSRMSTSELILSLTIVQTFLSGASIGFAYTIAILLGYKTAGSILLSLFILIITAISMIGFSILVAALCTSVNQILTVGVFPFFLMFFFTGAAFPLPSLKLLEFKNFSIHLNDILSPTHATNAIGKILNVGLGIESVMYEVISILILTIIYFYLGITFFHKRHLKKI